jgi:adenylosuccinate lyase
MNVASGLVVYPNIIHKHILDELPFMVTENILMAAVKRGGDRQALHEKIRLHSMDAARNVKEAGGNNDLLYRIAGDPDFNLTLSDLESELSPSNFTGFASEQTQKYITEIRDRFGAERDSTQAPIPEIVV